MREILKFTVPELEDIEFEVYAEATVRENQQIENAAAEVFGSRMAYEEAKAKAEVNIYNAKGKEDISQTELFTIISVREDLATLRNLAGIKVLGTTIPVNLEELSLIDFKFVERAYVGLSQRVFSKKGKG